MGSMQYILTANLALYVTSFKPRAKAEFGQLGNYASMVLTAESFSTSNVYLNQNPTAHFSVLPS